MNQSGFNLNSLELQIEQLEGKVKHLLDEELKEKNQNMQLEIKIRELEDQLEYRPKIHDKMQMHHQNNIEYLDRKIQNHQRTLLRFKSLYESLQNHHESKSIHPNPLNEDFMSASIMKQSKIKQNSQLKQSIGSFSSSLSHRDTENKKSMNVVCQMQCQNCGGIFKPYRYYSHINHCQKKTIVQAQMATSMLVN